jgi:aminoglycoside/choline kinase family phosphotransferase
MPQKKKEQLNRFIETARKLGADEDEATFKKKLGVIARQKLKNEPKRPPKEESK